MYIENKIISIIEKPDTIFPWRGTWHFIWKTEIQIPYDACTQFGLNWPCGSEKGFLKFFGILWLSTLERV